MASQRSGEAISSPKKRGRRVEVGIAVFLLVLSCVYFGSWFWAAFVTAFLFIGFKELTAMMAHLNTRPSSAIVLITGVLMILVATINKPVFLQALLTISVIASFFRLLFRHPIGSMADIGGTLLAVVYLAYLPVHFILLRELHLPPTLLEPLLFPVPHIFLSQPGLGYLLFTVVIICGSDVGAYYAGKRFGRSLLYPEVSPKKTREGALGGVIVGMVLGFVLSYVIGFPRVHALILSLILTVSGQIGDLVESVFKRNAGIKDSGEFLQGHGGLLDRTDSYIFSGAIAYYYIYWIVLGQGLAQDVARLAHEFL